MLLTVFTGCASLPATSPVNASSESESSSIGQGVVIGTLSVDGASRDLTHVYARRLFTTSDETSASNITRVILAAQALPHDALVRVFSDNWKGDGTAEGVVIDIDDDDDSWVARFLSHTGLRDLHGFTSKGGEAMNLEGRACGRVALSNQSDIGMRAFRASFNVEASSQGRSEQATTNSPTVLGEWRIQLLKTNQDRAYGGKIDIERAADGLLQAAAQIVDKTDGTVVTELFDVRVNRGTVKFFGVVSPDETWMADSLELRMEGSVLIGESEDEAGEIGTVRLQRMR